MVGEALAEELKRRKAFDSNEKMIYFFFFYVCILLRFFHLLSEDALAALEKMSLTCPYILWF